jgi:hypothetical protein
MSSVRDVVLVAVFVFLLGITCFVGYFMLSSAADAFLSNPDIADQPEAVDFWNKSSNITNRFDYLIFAVFIGMALGIVLTGYMVGGDKVFMAIYFLIVVLAVVFSTPLSNFWETITPASTFGTTITHFPITNHLILYLPLYTAAIGLVGIIAMFAKPEA